MRTVGIVLITVVIACGSPTNNTPQDAAADVGADALLVTAFPCAAGCAPEQRCTWIVDQPNGNGHIGCVAEGTLAPGTACTIPTSTANGGHDECMKGSFCADNVCRPVCDPAVATTCDTDNACVRYKDVFLDNMNLLAGVCEPQCDPLTQALKVGLNTAACGSSIASNPQRGCFATALDTYACMPTSAAHFTNTDRTAAAEPDGIAHANSCAPGYIAMMVEMTGSSIVICTGLCAPLDTDSAAGLNANGKGDGTVLGKQPTDPAPVAGHARCTPFASGGKGSVAAEECRYMWTALYDSTGNPIDSPYKDSLGYCLAYAQYSMPSCASLPKRSGATPGATDDADDWGCFSTATDLGYPTQPPTVQANLRVIRPAIQIIP